MKILFYCPKCIAYRLVVQASDPQKAAMDFIVQHLNEQPSHIMRLERGYRSVEDQRLDQHKEAIEGLWSAVERINKRLDEL